MAAEMSHTPDKSANMNNEPNMVSEAPISVVSGGRLKIAFKGKTLTSVSTLGASIPSSNTVREGINSVQSETASLGLAPSSTPQSTSSHAGPALQASKEVPNESTDYLNDSKWRARSLLQQLLAPREANYEFWAPSPATGPIPVVRIVGSTENSTMSPQTTQEALLMVAVLRAIGHPDSYRVLLPSRPSPSDTDDKTSSTSLSTPMNVDQVDSEAKNAKHESSSPFVLLLTKEEVQIAKQAAKSAMTAAANASNRWEEDQDSLALELELEFTQLDPRTRVELLKQLDLAEHEQFFESGARHERLARAAKEAAFHNTQISFDRARLGPYYFDPHTKTQQAYHSLAVPAPTCEPIALDPNHQNLAIINPDLPLPNGFSYFQQSPSDFHPSMWESLASNPHVRFPNDANSNSNIRPSPAQKSGNTSGNRSGSKLLVKSRATNGDKTTEGTKSPNTPSGAPSALFPDLPRPKMTTSDGKDAYRYSVMDGYAQWLKLELENHMTACAPIDLHDTWARQFRSQWEVLQPQGCFDYMGGDTAAQTASLSASTSLSAMSGSGTGFGGAKPVSSAIRKVWYAHRKHLESENAVQLAMENAERSRRRARFGDPSDLDIDPGKPLTRDERRKLHRNEKEYTKLKQLFLAQGLVDEQDFPLDRLSWYDFHTLFASLGISVAHLLEEEAAKNQLPAIIYGPNGQVRARSHKKGAARAAKLAAKKAAMEASNTTSNTSSNKPTSSHSSLHSATSTPSNTSSAAANPKKRQRSTLTTDPLETQQLQAQADSQYHHQRHRASTPYLDLTANNAEQCKGCGASDNADDFIHCIKCRNAYHIFCIDDPVDNDKQWVCPPCEKGH